MIVKEIALVLLGYLSGSMLFCKWFPKKIRGIDVAALSDDHNPGTANTFKQAGIGIGIAVLAGLLVWFLLFHKRRKKQDEQ